MTWFLARQLASDRFGARYIFSDTQINTIVSNVPNARGDYPRYGREHGEGRPDIARVAHGGMPRSDVWEIKPRNLQSFERGRREVIDYRRTLEQAFSRPTGNAPWHRGTGVQGQIDLHVPRGYVYRITFNQDAPPGQPRSRAAGVITYRITRSEYRHRRREDAYAHDFVTVSLQDLMADADELAEAAAEEIPVMLHSGMRQGSLTSPDHLGGMSEALASGGLEGVVYASALRLVTALVEYRQGLRFVQGLEGVAQQAAAGAREAQIQQQAQEITRRALQEAARRSTQVR